jgi:hypothetical protein
LRNWDRESKLGPPHVFSPDGKHILSRLGGYLLLWAVDGEKELWRAGGELGEVAFTADGKGVYVAGRSEFGRLDAATGKVVWMGDVKAPYVTGFAFAPDARRVLSAEGHHLQGGGDGISIRLKLWDGADGHLLHTIEVPQ